MSVLNTDNKENFFLWLKCNNSEKISSKINTTLCALNVLLQKNGTISTQLYKIEDPVDIENLINNIIKNQGIMIHSRCQRADFVNCLYQYKSYLELKDRDKEISSIETDETVHMVSLTENKDYSYTRPISVRWCGDYYKVNNWTMLYVQTIKCLYLKYPNKIQSLLGKNIGGRGHVDITDENGANEMREPKEIVTGLFLETNYSADRIIKKIRQWMDVCNAVYSSVEIRYIHKSTSTKTAQIVREKIQSEGEVDNYFFEWLTREAKLAVSTGWSYVSYIHNCDTFCRDHNIGTGKICGLKSSDEINHNIELLLVDEKFQDYNNQLHYRYTVALEKYQMFLASFVDNVSVSNLVTKPASSAVSHVDEMRIRATLELPRFEYGFKADGVELYRFRASYSEVNGMDCSLEDEQLITVIRDMGFEFDGKVYLIPDTELENIISTIREYKKQDINVIYYDSLYDLNLDEYFNIKIISSDMLKAILMSIIPEFQYRNKYFTLSDEKKTEIELIKDDIIRVWGDNILRSFDELFMELPLIPQDKVKTTLSQQKEFIWNSAETYTRADFFETDKTEIVSLISNINEQCEKYGRVSLDEISWNNLKSENPELSNTAIYNCFYKLIEDQFDRNAMVLTRKGTSKSIHSAVIEFCAKQERCTYDQMVRLAEQVAGTIRNPEIIDAANTVMVRIDKENFVADRCLQFDVKRIDMALDDIIPANYLGMREITTFSIFPFCGYSWNLFLLESYCRKFSKKYTYITRRANSSNSGAVVAKSCAFSYHDILVDAIARSGRNLNQEEVLSFLTETGFIERKRYRDIDLLINEAAELREKRK